MTRLNILSWKDARPTFFQSWWQSFLQPWFDTVWIDGDNFDHNLKQSLVIIRPYLDNWQQKVTSYRDQGYKVIVEDLWEYPFESTIIDGIMTLRSQNFFRINECLWYKYLNFDQYYPSDQKSKMFLLLMRLKKHHRDKIYKNFSSILHQGLYSYTDIGKFIEDDIDQSDNNWQRHFNPKWYNSTHFSIVAETSMQPMTFVTEKTYKPLAYYHPFVVFGAPGTLAHLHNQGFETFEHLIDESYDLEKTMLKRFDMVCNLVFDIVKQLESNANLFQDSLTQQKLIYNHHTFFDTALVQQLFCDDILTQILNFVETS